MKRLVGGEGWGVGEGSGETDVARAGCVVTVGVGTDSGHAVKR